MRAEREVLIVSAYFVPGEAGTRRFAELEQRGVRVVVQTNSLAATDVAAVHTGYMRYRKDLLRAGVELYETKSLADSDAGRRRISVTGSSGASLHTKAIIVDDRWVYIGSMNIDPRANLNTEMGVLIESTVLARQVRATVRAQHHAGAELPRRARGRQARLVRQDRRTGSPFDDRARCKHLAPDRRQPAACAADRVAALAVTSAPRRMMRGSIGAR